MGNGVDLRDSFFEGRFFVYFFLCSYFGLDCLVLILFFFVFFFFEIFATPGIFAERGLIDRAGIDDDAGFYGGFEIDAAQV